MLATFHKYIVSLFSVNPINLFKDYKEYKFNSYILPQKIANFVI